MRSTYVDLYLKQIVMIRVYFESKNHSELVATFESEELYMVCLPSLEEEAKKHRMIVTESITNQ